MSDKRHFIFAHDTARRQAAAWCMNAPEGYHCRIEPPTRTLDQNAYQFPYLEGFARQLLWPVNGEMVKLDKLEWKDILTAAFEKEVNPRIAMGIDGGVVMLGRRTSKFGKKKFAEWMTYLMAIADIRGVKPVFKDGEHKKWEGAPE